MALLSTMETCSVSTLNWWCLIALVGCWGGKTRCLLILLLELTSSWLVVLAILLLMLRVLPLKLLLLSWALVLSELLRWVAWETRAIAASRLGSTDLTLAILLLFALPLCHDRSVD
jgi:Na+-driven multidrug efflux pump